MKKKAVILAERQATIHEVYGKANLAYLKEKLEVYPEILCSADLKDPKHAEFLKESSFIFSSWGFPAMTDNERGLFTKLEAIFYAAGSVKAFAEPFLKRNVKVVSAWQANAVPVAEFTLGQIILSMKSYFRNTMDCRSPEKRHTGDCTRGPGLYGETVGLIGCGMIAKLLIKFLKNFNLKIAVFDPFMSEEAAKSLGVEKMSLEELFKKAFVVSNHLPDLPETRGMLKGNLFSSMRQGATFINTGRGAQVVEVEFIEVLKKRSDLTALLDVTYPEPPEADSEFYTLPNVQLSSHIAGSANDELLRMSSYVIEDFDRYTAGEEMKYSINLDMFYKMA